MKYKYHKSIGIALICITLGGRNVQAQTSGTCTTCFSTPTQIQDRNNFVSESLAIVKQSQARQNILGSTSFNGGFTQGLFAIGSQNIIKRLIGGITTNMNQKVQTLGATLFLVTSIGTQLISKDGPGGVAVVFQSKPILRDRTLLQDIDSMIGDEIFALGVAGGYTKKLTTAQTTQFNNLLKKYSGEGTLFDTSSRIDENQRFDEIMTALRRINGRFKSFLSIDHLNALTQNYTRKGIYIQFANGQESLAQKLHKAYACARGLATSCNTSVQNFIKSIKNTSKTAKADIDQSFKTFETSFGRLKTLLKTPLGAKGNESRLNNDQKELLERQNELLQTQNGFQKSNGGINLRINGKQTQLKDLFSKKEDGLSNFKQQAQRQITQEATNANSVRNDQEQNTQKRFENELKKSITTIVAIQELGAQSTQLTDPRATTLMIRALTTKVQKSQEIIGDKDADQDLISSLGRACELQCSNLGGKCWYDG